MTRSHPPKKSADLHQKAVAALAVQQQAAISYKPADCEHPDSSDLSNTWLLVVDVHRALERLELEAAQIKSSGPRNFALLAIGNAFDSLRAAWESFPGEEG